MANTDAPRPSVFPLVDQMRETNERIGTLKPRIAEAPEDEREDLQVELKQLEEKSAGLRQRISAITRGEAPVAMLIGE